MAGKIELTEAPKNSEFAFWILDEHNDRIAGVEEPLGEEDVQPQRLVDCYNAFQPGGCVERLLRAMKFTPAGNLSAVQTDFDEINRCRAELEALLPKRTEQKMYKKMQEDFNDRIKTLEIKIEILLKTGGRFPICLTYEKNPNSSLDSCKWCRNDSVGHRASWRQPKQMNAQPALIPSEIEKLLIDQNLLPKKEGG